jgi:hypothetical protein
LDDLKLRELQFLGRRPQEEQQRSSTWRELMVVEQAIAIFKAGLGGFRVKWNYDNSAATRILESGSNNSSLHVVAVHVAEICLRKQIQLFTEWIARGSNVIADGMSHWSEREQDDWSLQPQRF